jgi:hypothetical protein
VGTGTYGIADGYHYEQTGIDYRNGPFGPVDVYPHYDWVPDQTN